MIFGIILLVGGVVYASGVVTFGSSNKGLVGHWSLDYEDYNPSTLRVTDKTPYENHGTNNGATFSTDRMGQTNGSMSFDGSNDVVRTDDVLINNESWTVASWIFSLNGPDAFPMFYRHHGTQGIICKNYGIARLFGVADDNAV